MQSSGPLHPLIRALAAATLLAGCVNTTTPPFDVGYQPGPRPDTGHEDENDTEVVEHCGAITSAETWSAAAHHITCPVQVEQGASLTIEAGALVEFSPGASIEVGVGTTAGGLTISGTSQAPVLLRPVERGQSWDGLKIGSLAAAVSLHHTTIEGASIQLHQSEATLVEVDILDAPAVGLELDQATLSPSSHTLLITGSGSFPVAVDAGAAHTIPAEDSLYVGNQTDRIWVRSEPITTSASWPDLGVPWELSATLAIEGSGSTNAVLTLQAGTVLIIPEAAGLNIGTDGNTQAGLRIEGSESAPVRLIADPALPSGSWRGLSIGAGALPDHLSLHHVQVERAGTGHPDGAAISVVDSAIELSHVVIEHAPGPGVQLLGSATFTSGSSHLTVQDSGYPLWLSPDAVESAPLDTLLQERNSDDHLLLDTAGWGDITGSLHLRYSDIPWRANSSIEVRGTASQPARLEVDAGAVVQLPSGHGVQVAHAGAAELVLKGSTSEPITFTSATDSQAGAWVGLSLGADCIASTTELDGVVVRYGGHPGDNNSANFTLEGCTPATWGTLRVQDSLGWGAIFIDTDIASSTVVAVRSELGDVDCRGTVTACSPSP